MINLGKQISQQTKLISNKQIIYFFHTYFIKNLDIIYSKFLNHTNLNDIIYFSCNIMFNVFWIIFNSENNIFITLFLSEKSILLFSEFILLLNDPKIIKDLYYKPNIIDALHFSYKKTIHSVNISSLLKNHHIDILTNTCFIIKEITNLYYIQNRIILEKCINLILEMFNKFNNKNCFIFINKLYKLENNPNKLLINLKNIL